MYIIYVTAPEISEAFKGRRRVAPPPPEDFRHLDSSSIHGPVRRYPPLEPPLDRGGRDRELRDRNYSPSPPPPKMRRAPPRSPPDMHDDIESGAYPVGHRTNRDPNMRPDEWADPWMRGMHNTRGRGGHRGGHDGRNPSMPQRPLTARNGRNDSLHDPSVTMDDGRPQRGGRTGSRRRSYSSGSSHSSSSSDRNRNPGEPRSRSKSKIQQGRRGRRVKGERRRRSSGSSHSSGSSPSPHHRRNKRSSSPEYIARRQGVTDIKKERNRSKSPNSLADPSSVRIKSENGARGAADNLMGSKSQAPLQKRLGAMAAGISLGPSPSGFTRTIKKEPEETKRPGGARSGGNANLIPLGARPTQSPQKQPNARRRRTTTRSNSIGSSRSSSGEDRRSPSNRKMRRRSSGRRSRSPRGREIKKEPGGRHSGATGSSQNKPAVPLTISTSKSVRDSKHSPTKALNPPLPKSPPKEKQGPFKLSFTKSSSGSTKPANKTVLEKLGAPVVDRPSVSATLQSQTDSASSSKTLKRKISDSIDSNPSRSEKISKKTNESISKSESKSTDKKAESKKEKKSAADRREELMKQLKAVENAIAKKRVKIG